MEKAVIFNNSLKFQPLPNGESIAYRSHIPVKSTETLLLLHGWLCTSLGIWDDLV